MDNRKGTILLSLPLRSSLFLERFLFLHFQKLEQLLHDIFRSLSFPSIVACRLGSDIDRQKRIGFVHYARNNLTLLNLSIDFNLVERAWAQRWCLDRAFLFHFNQISDDPVHFVVLHVLLPSLPRRFVSFSLRARERIICLLCRLENNE